jgi:hypothetical protein
VSKEFVRRNAHYQWSGDKDRSTVSQLIGQPALNPSQPIEVALELVQELRRVGGATLGRGRESVGAERRQLVSVESYRS